MCVVVFVMVPPSGQKYNLSQVFSLNNSLQTTPLKLTYCDLEYVYISLCVFEVQDVCLEEVLLRFPYARHREPKLAEPEL